MLTVYVWLESRPLIEIDLEFPGALTVRQCPDRSGIPVDGFESLIVHSNSIHPISMPGDDGKSHRTEMSLGDNAVASTNGTGPGGSVSQ